MKMKNQSSMAAMAARQLNAAAAMAQLNGVMKIIEIMAMAKWPGINNQPAKLKQ